MATEHFRVHEGMEVMGADHQQVGRVREVHDSVFVADSLRGPALSVPFAAIADVRDNTVVLTLTAAHVEKVRALHQKATRR